MLLAPLSRLLSTNALRSSLVLRAIHSTTTGRTMSNTSYPHARRDDDSKSIYQSATKGKVEIEDPYAWLENPPSESPETQAWVDEQVKLTDAAFAKVSSQAQFKKALQKNWDFSKFSSPSLMDDGYYYYSFNSGLQNQYVTYRFPESDLDLYSQQSSSPPGEVFFDPNQLSEDGTVSLSTSAFSKGEGKYWAYGLSKSGSDWSTVYVRDTTGKFGGVNDARKMSDEVKFVKFSSLTWTHDSKGFFYQRFPTVQSADALGTATASDKNAQLFYHVLGTSQSEDVLVHEDPDHPEYIFGVSITTCGRWALRETSKDTNQSALLHIARIDDIKDAQGFALGKLEWKDVVTEWGAVHSYLANDDEKFYVQTNKDAPNWKVQTFDLSAATPTFTDLIPEDKDGRVLGQARLIRDDLFVVTYSHHVNDELYLYTKGGERIRRLIPDFVGSLGGVSGRRKHDRWFISQTSYTNAGSVLTFDLSKSEAETTGELELLRETKMDLKPADFISEQIFYASKDGTKIPMTITRHKDVKLDGSAPALLYGYGGFNIDLTPRFSTSWMTWVSSYRGVLAVPNLRGGGEYGEAWHEGGIREKKQNTFDDFLSAARYLVDNKFTSKGKLILNGGSNGGLLVAACTNQAEEGLIGASVADVGVMDLLKFHRWTIGRLWTSDYGNPDEPKDFDFIYPISPLHNVNPKKTYPPYLITTADHDDRVVPAHSFKLAAELQHSLKDNKNPLLIRIEVKAGHGAGKPTQKIISESAEKWSWASEQVGAKFVE